jgi:hypothetical protein
MEGFVNSNAYSSNFLMIFINFVCILVLYILVMYLFSKYMDIDDQILELNDYRTMNDRQINNLIKDINYNDQHITKYIEAKGL